MHHDPVQARVPSEQARNAAAAVMRTNFPSMLAEMNPDWDPLIEEDLLHRPEDTSDSAELVPSDEYWTTDEHDSDSDERGGFSNIQRVVAVPARLREDGGIERIGPSEVISISEADPAWTRIIGLHIALTRTTKSEHLQEQQFTPHCQCPLKIVGSGEEHVV